MYKQQSVRMGTVAGLSSVYLRIPSCTSPNCGSLQRMSICTDLEARRRCGEEGVLVMMTLWNGTRCS